MPDSDILKPLVSWLGSRDSDDAKSGTGTYISSKINVRTAKGYGRGIYAEGSIKKGELLIKIPLGYLINRRTIMAYIAKYNSEIDLHEYYYSNIKIDHVKHMDTVSVLYSKFEKKELEQMTSFQQSAIILCLEMNRIENSYWKPFINSLPDFSDFQPSPLVWKVMNLKEAKNMLRSLPKSCQDHASKVYKRYMVDYKFACSYLTKKVELSRSLDTESALKIVETELIDKKKFLWVWLSINSRCLYMEMPQKTDEKDNFTMAPYVDFINHSADDHCNLKIDGTGFKVFSTREYSENDEIYLSYGAHSNDFLLNEYAFTMKDNKWNDLDITYYFDSIFNDFQKEFLKKNNYFGNYTINEEGEISFRTEVALATLQEQSPQESRRLIALINGFSDGKTYKKDSDYALSRLLRATIDDCDKRMELIENIIFPHDLKNIRSCLLQINMDKKIIAEKTMHILNNIN